MGSIEDDTLLDERSAAEETLLDERRRRTPAAVAGSAAGLLTMGGGAVAAWVYGDLPSVPVLDTLRERFSAQEPSPGLKALQVRWYDDNVVKLVLVAVVLALAAAAIGVVLTHLYLSVKARRPELPRYIVYAAVAGAVLVAVSGIVQAIAVSLEASSFAASSNQSSDAARDVLAGPFIVASLLLRQVGVFALGLAFVLLALNGMRVGLLTRFMGVLGIIVGVLFIVPIGSSLPIVQAFWLASLGVLFAGRWPSDMPPAWVTGEAQPWPTQQELREARMEAQGAKLEDEDEKPPRRIGRRERAEAPETPAPEVPVARRPHPSSKKKHKRKRR